MRTFGTPRQGLAVSTYNVHSWVGTDGRRDPFRTLRVIADLRAEVVGLQEVSLDPGKEDVAQIQARVSALGFALRTGTSTRPSGFHGNAMLSSLPILGSRCVDLSVGSGETRCALLTELALDDGARVAVLLTHLSLAMSERRIQVQRIMVLLSQLSADLIIMMGDFNEWLPFSGSLQRIGRWFGKPPALRTYPAALPLFSLDRIWVKPAASLRELTAVRTGEARVASDHLPLRARLAVEVPLRARGVAPASPDLPGRAPGPAHEPSRWPRSASR